MIAHRFLHCLEITSIIGWFRGMLIVQIRCHLPRRRPPEQQVGSRDRSCFGKGVRHSPRLAQGAMHEIRRHVRSHSCSAVS